MLNFTIKTLDSDNHEFSVEDETTVLQLKENIEKRLGIEIAHQRLIFCGRVMQDEKKLSEYNVDGKVCHLVQRVPPSPSRPSSRLSSISDNGAASDSVQQQIRRLMALANPSDPFTEQHHINATPTTARLEFIRNMIAEIQTSLNTLQNIEEQFYENSFESAENVQQVDENNRNSTTTPDNSRSTFIRTTINNRSRTRCIRDFVRLLEELERLEENFAPFRARYMRILHLMDNPETPHYSGDTQLNTQFVTVVLDVMHCFAHVYHAISDITVELGPRATRLTSEPPVVQTLPMQTHINVIQADRRPLQQQAPNAPGGDYRESAPTQPSDTATNPENSSAGQDAQTGRSDHQYDQSNRVNQSSEDINIHQDPVTYQVEIETRVPITIPIDNNLISGLATVNMMTPSRTVANSQNPNEPQDQGAQQRPTNPRQVFYDFENLFRGLSQAGAVEVVMSMQEIPQGGVNSDSTAAPNASATPNVANTQQEPSSSAPPNEVYITQMPWGGAPNADVLQNIVTSVINQGIVPAIEGITSQGQTVNQLIQGHIQNQATANAPTQDTNSAQANQGQQGTQNQANSSTQPRPAIHIRRGPTTVRPQTVSLTNLIYDRFLQCESIHARRRLQRRREEYQQQVTAREELRLQRALAQDITHLRERIPNIPEEHFDAAFRMLQATPSPETWLNAFMLAVARSFFMSEPLHTLMGDAALLPNEYLNLRHLFRELVQHLLSQSSTAHDDNALESVADCILLQHASFINNLHTLAPLRQDVDVSASIRTITRARLPVVVVTAMSDSLAETFVARFYSVFNRLFVDLCLLILFFCENGVEGLRAIYNSYMAYLMQDFDGPIREMIESFGAANLERTIQNMNPQVHDIRQYVRFRPGGVPSNPSATISEDCMMDVSPTISKIDAGPSSTQSGDPQASHDVAPVTENDQPRIVITVCAPPDPNVSQTGAATNISAGSDTTQSTGSIGLPRVPSHVVSSNAPYTPPITMLNSQDSSSSPDLMAIPRDQLLPLISSPPPETQALPSGTLRRFLNIRRRLPDMPQSPPITFSGQPQTSQSAPATPTVTRKMDWSQWTEEFGLQLSSDYEDQSDNPQEPSSDLYLTGMSGRKRRCIRQSRPSTTLVEFMTESISEVIENRDNAGQESPTMMSAFIEHVRSLSHERATISFEYDSEIYIPVDTFINADNSALTLPLFEIDEEGT